MPYIVAFPEGAVEFMSKFCRCTLIVCIIVRWEGWSIEEAEEFGTKAVLGVWVHARWVKVPRVTQKEWVCFGRTAVRRMLPEEAYVVDAERTYHYCLAVSCETTVDAKEQSVERFTARSLIMTQQHLVPSKARTWNIAAAFTGRVWHRN